MGGHSPEEIHQEMRKYWIVFFGLIVLTVVTVLVSYLDLTPGMAVLVAMIVAMFKAGLVAAVFMHLISERKAIYALLILTVAFFVVLMIGPGAWRAGSSALEIM